MKSIRFYVTAQDVKEGKRWNGSNCPVARSMTRRLGHSVLLVRTSPYWNLLPQNVKEIIEQYDDTGKMKPFRFGHPAHLIPNL